MKGSYTLLIKLSETSKTEVGSLGKIEFRKGFYAYNGSAFGPGGLKRVERHKEKSRKANNPHWHIDYLLVQENSEIVEVFKGESDHECGLSQRMDERFMKVEDFGSSDCDCGSHFFYSQERGSLESFLESFYS